MDEIRGESGFSLTDVSEEIEVRLWVYVSGE